MQNTKVYSKEDLMQQEWERKQSFTKEYTAIDENLAKYKVYLQQSERIYLTRK